jgi:hypothetical protein
MVNQALQGNQMDFSIFQNNVNANKEEGGFDWDNSPQGESFWTEVEGSTERDRISMFRDNDINDFAEKDIIIESNPTTTTQINTKASDLVKEIEEGENRVEYFRNTKQDSLKEFAKDFPEAEAPLNKLLDLLSIKEEGRLKKLPKKKKKKKEEKSKTIEVGKRNITRETELKKRLENDLIESGTYLLSIPDSIDEQDQLPEIYGGNEYTGAINTKEQLRDNIILIAKEINEINDFLDSEFKKEQGVESEVELTAKDINELIEGLELAFEYLDGEDLQDALDQIEGLKITLDYI